MRAPERKFARLQALCLALAYLLLQLGGAWHVSQQGHARCAEHGEWVDVSHGINASPARDEQGPVAIASESSQAHDHCLIVEASRVRSIACQSTLFEVAHEVLATSVPLRAAEPLDPLGFDRFLLAPKQSPPC